MTSGRGKIGKCFMPATLFRASDIFKREGEKRSRGEKEIQF